MLRLLVLPLYPLFTNHVEVHLLHKLSLSICLSLLPINHALINIINHIASTLKSPFIWKDSLVYQLPYNVQASKYWHVQPKLDTIVFPVFLWLGKHEEPNFHACCCSLFRRLQCVHFQSLLNCCY